MNDILQYTSPATSFTEALPIGNGRIGGMVYGGIGKDLIGLNEDSIWSGGPRYRVNPDAREGLAEVRRLLFEGDIPAAEKIVFEKMQGIPEGCRHYMPLGDLTIEFGNDEAGDSFGRFTGRVSEEADESAEKEPDKANEPASEEDEAKNSGSDCGKNDTAYRRELDISRAVACVKYTESGVEYVREYFVSAPDNALVMNIKSSVPGKISLAAELGGRDDYYDNNRPCGDNMIMFSGGSGSENGIAFAAVLCGKCEGGTIRTLGSKLVIENADEAFLAVTARTSFYECLSGKRCVDVSDIAEECINTGKTKNTSEMEECTDGITDSRVTGEKGFGVTGYAKTEEKSNSVGRYADHALEDARAILERDYGIIRKDHIADYKRYYDRVKLTLNDNSEGASGLPTDLRLARIKNGLDGNVAGGTQGFSGGNVNTGGISDNKLMELYFKFGRYLMISGSRPGTQPLNLQGIWNKDMWPAWGSKYTVNINAEMNYWPAESCNLSECHEPLFDLLERVSERGRIVAKEMYGANKGFVCHHNTDIWGDSAPQDKWMPATIWPMGAAWLALHVFEHYEYTRDIRFLSEKYNLIKGAAEFFTEFLVEDGKGHLVTCPSVSPENTYKTEKGVTGCLAVGPSMDSQIITVLFESAIKCTEILGTDGEFAEELKGLLEKIPKPEVGKYGTIKEWAEDYDEVEIGHRHISHLFALYPADMIAPNKTPELAGAARATLERRLSHGGGHTGWSRAWITNMWARLYDGEKVYDSLLHLLGGSTCPNMLDDHPPFQIDGNFGGTAAIAEALLQCTNGEIVLLPALPKEWKNGSVKGLRAKGGFTVDIEWNEGNLSGATITPDFDGKCRVRIGERVTEHDMISGKTVTIQRD